MHVGGVLVYCERTFAHRHTSTRAGVCGAQHRFVSGREGSWEGGRVGGRLSVLWSWDSVLW